MLRDKFINGVQSGEIVSCLYVKQAVDRFVNDLKRQNTKDFPFYFDEEAAEQKRSFIQLMRHTDAEWKGKPFNLQPFQAFIIDNLFGWKRCDNHTRRFRRAYVSMARKGAKTELAAAIANAMLFADGEGSPEVYTAATKYTQAKIAFNCAKSMVRQLCNDSSGLKGITEIWKEHVYIKGSDGIMMPVAFNPEKLDGFRPHCVVVDEYHAHPTSELLEVMVTGQGSRAQPLSLVITTAGFNTGSPCYHLERVVRDILSGKKHDESQFGIIWTMDEGDDWRDEKNWAKPNPMMGITPKIDYMRDQYLKAVNEGQTSEIQFKTKNLNTWTSQSSTYISDYDWTRAATSVSMEELYGMKCWGGLDFSATKDFTFLTLFFPPQEGLDRATALYFPWLPAEVAAYRAKEDKTVYVDWIAQGHIYTCPGHTIDHNAVAAVMIPILDNFDVQSIACDDWNILPIARLFHEAGYKIEGYRQGYKSMNRPTKELEMMVLNNYNDFAEDAGQVCFNPTDNPVMRWMIGNVSLSVDAADNWKIDKAKSVHRVDGPVSLAMAIGNWIDDTSQSAASVYASDEDIDKMFEDD